MSLVLTELSKQTIANLKRKHVLSDAEIVEQALLRMELDNADWDAILANEPINQDLSEEAAYALAVAEVRAYRSSK